MLLNKMDVVVHEIIAITVNIKPYNARCSFLYLHIALSIPCKNHLTGVNSDSFADFSGEHWELQLYTFKNKV